MYNELEIYMPQITLNKKLGHDYEILEKLEAGLLLTGNEVKVIKQGQIDLKGSYIEIRISQKKQLPEAWLIGAQIAKYKKAGYSQKDYNPKRSRKLLLKRQEINTLVGKTKQKGLTLLPLSVYTTSHRLIKITIVLARGKKKFDKREAIKKRDFERREKRLVKR